MCSIALIHVKINIWTTVLKLLLSLIICSLITLNELWTSREYQLCTHNQSWDMDILKSNCYCIMYSIALMHVKIKIYKKLLKNCCKSFIICCLITLKQILIRKKIQLCTHNQSWDMDILKCDCYCIMSSIALMHIKIKI